MISFFRRALSSWVVLALLGLVLVAFVVTGIQDPFGTGGGASGANVASVGKKQISENQLINQFERLMKSLRADQPELTNERAVRDGALEQLLEQMIGADALEQFGLTSGLVASPRMIDAEIAAVDAFKGPNGQFDQMTYEQALKAQGISARDLRDGISGDLIRSQLLVPLMADKDVPQQLVIPYAQLLLEKRKASIATVPSAAFPVAAPTDAQVSAFYKAKLATYTIPERRSFSYALIEKARLQNDISVTADEISAYYKAHQDEYAGTEKRVIEQAVLPDRAQADALIKRVRAGESFTKTATEVVQLSASDLALGTLAQSELTSLTNSAVATAAFAASKGQVTDAVQSDFGWHVVFVRDVVQSSGRSLASVEGEIRTKLTSDKTDAAFAELTGKIEDAIDGGESLSDVIKTHKLTLVEVPPVTRDGRVFGKLSFTPDQRVGALLKRVFESDPADGAIVEILDPSLAAVMAIGDVVVPAPMPLADIRSAVAADWTRDQQMARAKAAADAILADVNGGKTLAAALLARKMPPAQTIEGQRLQLIQQNQQVPPPVAMAFALPAKAIRTLRASNNQGYFIIKVDAVTPAEGQPDPNLIAALRNQMAGVAASEMVEQFTRAVVKDSKVDRNPTALARVKARYTGATNAADE